MYWKIKVLKDQHQKNKSDGKRVGRRIYLKARQIHVEFVGGDSWPIQCCAQYVEAGFMANVQK